MSRAVLISIEGVLAEDKSDNLMECSPHLSGKILWEALRTQFEIVLLTERFARSEHIEKWLQRENLKGTGVNTYWPTPERPEFDQVITHVRMSHDIQLFITTSPALAKSAYLNGIEAMLLVSPDFGRAEWRPDFINEPRPWDELVSEIDETRLLHAGDTRRKTEA